MLRKETTMKKVFISVFGIAAVGFLVTCGLNFTKAVAQTATPATTCGIPLMCDPGGKPYTGEYDGNYYVMGIQQSQEGFENHLISTSSLLEEPLGALLDTSLNQSIDEPLDVSLNQPIGEKDTDSPTQDDSSLTVDPDESQPGF